MVVFDYRPPPSGFLETDFVDASLKTLQTNKKRGGGTPYMDTNISLIGHELERKRSLKYKVKLQNFDQHQEKHDPPGVTA